MTINFFRYVFSMLLSLLIPTILLGYEYQLSIVTIFKDNAPFLKEWIEYHRLVGVEHFYLYDNSSSDNPREVLEPYIRENIVTLIDWPTRGEETWGNEVFGWVWTTQMPAIQHACDLSKDKTKWLAVIDSDEFITPIEGDNILKILKKYNKYPGVIMYWLIYGTSHVYDIPPGRLMIELLTLRCPVEHPRNNHCKVIIKPKELDHYIDPHTCAFNNGKAAITLAREEMRINHYFNRTVKFFYEHKVNNKQYIDNVTWSDEDIKIMSQLGNDIEDRTMDKFVPDLRERMGFND